MGLDQYAYIVDNEKQLYEEDIREDFHWRKHNRLQGWMESLWRSKGNTKTFNCENLELTIDDLIALQHDIEEKDLPETTGFFYGQDSYENYDGRGYKKEDEKFIKRAIEAIKEGKKVFYSCWY